MQSADCVPCSLQTAYLAPCSLQTAQVLRLHATYILQPWDLWCLKVPKCDRKPSPGKSISVSRSVTLSGPSYKLYRNVLGNARLGNACLSFSGD